MKPLPPEIRYQIKERLWMLADKIDWTAMDGPRKSHQYDDWVKNPEIGGILSRYIDSSQVRVYIKDSIMKPYPRVRLAEPKRLYRVLGIAQNEEPAEVYIKPHGIRLADGRVFSWGRAKEWKTIVMSLHERTYGRRDYQAFAVVLCDSSGKYHQPKGRAVVEAAAKCLGVSRIIWLD